MATLFLGLIGLYTYRLGDVPAGLFCDEAEIGYHAYQFLHHDKSFLITPFFCRHFQYIIGALPVYTALPFVGLFGLTEFSVRLASACFGLACLGLLYVLLRLLEIRPAAVVVLQTALTPLFFHLSRVNFGHLPACFFLLLGCVCYFLAQTRTPWLAFLSGLSFGISVYGYPSYLLATPLLIALLWVSELFYNRGQWRRYWPIVLTSLAFALCCLPVVAMLARRPEFLNRFREKSRAQPVLGTAAIERLGRNYGKYFSYDYLFRKGEEDYEGVLIRRHWVRGNGLFLAVTFPIVLAGLVLFFLDRGPHKKLLLPFALLLPLYPLPDLLTTADRAPPYSFALFATLVCVPMVTACVFRGRGNVSRALGVVATCGIVIAGAEFLGNYWRYPLNSADYWGWQYGPKEIVRYFQEHKDSYDALYMTELFNAPESLLRFYDPERRCGNCFIGGIENLRGRVRQLFAVRVEETQQRKWRARFEVRKVIRYPNGSPGFLIVELVGGGASRR